MLRAVATLALIFACSAHAGEAEWKALHDQVMPRLMSGQLERAEKLARDALAEAERTFGPRHRNTEATLANLALAVRLQQRFEEAEKIYRRALPLRVASLGAAHPNTALMKINLADVLQAQKKYAEAEKLQREALPVFEKAHGEDPKTATALNNLGANLQLQGRHKEAEPLLRRALAMKEITLGPYHQSVASTLNNLAEVSLALGRADEAKVFKARVAAIQQSAAEAKGQK